MMKNIKYKVHYKNDRLDQVADSMYETICFEETLFLAFQHIENLSVVQGIGLYEILYNYERYLASVH